MRVQSSIWAICAALVAPLPAMGDDDQAPPMVLAPNGSYELDQDSPDNSISVWQLTTLANVNAIRAKLTVHRIGERGANPTFGIELSNDADAVQFQAFTKPGKTSLIPLISEAADHTENVSGLAGGLFLSHFDVGETVDVDVDWTDAGVVTVTLRDKSAINGFERHTVTMRGGPPTKLKVVAMTGEGEWKPLQIGRTGAQPQ